MHYDDICTQVNPEGKYVVDIDKDIDINKCTPNTRVALRNDSYVLHKILPTKVISSFSVNGTISVLTRAYNLKGI